MIWDDEIRVVSFKQILDDVFGAPGLLGDPYPVIVKPGALGAVITQIESLPAVGDAEMGWVVMAAAWRGEE